MKKGNKRNPIYDPTRSRQEKFKLMLVALYENRKKIIEAGLGEDFQIILGGRIITYGK